MEQSTEKVSLKGNAAERIGLIDVDGHHYPNLPLMKISAYHKSIGNEVEWYNPLEGMILEYDAVYASKVFSFTPDYQYPIYSKKIFRGGSGYCIDLVDGKEIYNKENDISLPYEIEHMYPDYSLYPGQTKGTAFGFLTRGCPRGCGFCHVAAKEGKCSVKVADLSEFWRGQKKIVLCDPNILACREHPDLLRQLIDSKAKVNFNQGLDIRLVNERNLELLSRIKLDIVHFAFDRWQDKNIVEPKLREFRAHSKLSHRYISVYILCNYDTTFEQDMYRIQLCRELDMTPYPMIYDKEHCDPIYRRLQRWCNPFIFWKCERFEDYKGGQRRDGNDIGKTEGNQWNC